MQSLKEKSLPDYDVTLGARLNNATTTNGSSEGVDSVATSYGHSPPSNGLQALTSSPSDNYSYYAKTCVRSGDPGIHDFDEKFVYTQASRIKKSIMFDFVIAGYTSFLRNLCILCLGSVVLLYICVIQVVA